jgi:pimeloyl-ACP methyl ester carboxylesterase
MVTSGRLVTSRNAVQPPSKLLLLLEGRAFTELGFLYWTYPLLRTAPHGDGHPVLVLPGFVVSDSSTLSLRYFLKSRGYAVQGWGFGQNWGRNWHPHHGLAKDLVARVTALAAQTGRKVSLVGWSLGGLYARELARTVPECVRLVITMGSPFTGHPKANNVWRLFEMISGTRIDDWDPELLERSREPLPVPSTSIYSRSDGVVAWQCSLESEGPKRENIEVISSHCGLGHHPLALYAIADRLAQPEGRWRPFRRTGLRRLLYRTPQRTSG